jgi:hypothetical protein
MGHSRESLVCLRWRKGSNCAIVIAFFAALGAGCATSQSPGPGSADAKASWLRDGETIAILSSPQFLFHWEHDIQATSIDPLACARQGLLEEGVGDRVVSEETFKRVAFPDLPPQAAPTDPESVRLLLTHPTLLDRIEPLNLRYIVYATSETEIRDAFVYWSGVAGAHGGAIVGRKDWKQSSEYSFLVIDAKAIKDVASANSREDGTGWWIAGMVVLPFALGYESPTEQAACERMALELRDALRSNTTQ